MQLNIIKRTDKMTRLMLFKYQFFFGEENLTFLSKTGERIFLQNKYMYDKSKNK